MTEILLTAVSCAVAILFAGFLSCRIKCWWYLRQLRKLEGSDMGPWESADRDDLLRRLEVYDQQCIPDVKRVIKDIQIHQARKGELK